MDSKFLLHLEDLSDQGCGFSPELPNALATKGFGLLRMRERARSFGGELAIESKQGQGSCFTLKVPLTL